MLREFEWGRSSATVNGGLRWVVLKPRQVFFTTWELARDLWTLITQEGSHTAVVCPSDAKNYVIREVTARAETMLGLDDPSQGLVGRHPWVKSLLRWEEGELRFGTSRLEIKGAGASRAAAEKAGRSGTLHRLHVTEMSSFEFAESTWGAIEPAVSVSENSEVTIESTAKEAAGKFYDLYKGAKEGASSFRAFFFAWMRHHEYRTPLEDGEVIKAETPREREMIVKYGASAEQVKWYRAKVADLGSQEKADQEFPMDEETCWSIGGRQFFNQEKTKELLTETRAPISREPIASSVPDPTSKNELLTWKPPKPRGRYVIVGDPSEGVVGGDPSAGCVYDRDTGEHVASVHGRWRTHEFATVLEAVGCRYNQALIVIERINHGHAVLNALLRLEIPAGQGRREPYPNVFFDEDEQAGWKTGVVQRAVMLEAFEKSHRTGEWKSPDRDLLDEMQRFIIGRTGKPEAAPGAFDDRVIANGIAWKILSVPIAQKPRTGSGKSEYRYQTGENGRGFY